VEWVAGQMEMVPFVGGILEVGMLVAEGARMERCCGAVIPGEAVLDCQSCCR
jgi:hypothetical protein